MQFAGVILDHIAQDYAERVAALFTTSGAKKFHWLSSLNKCR